jgi:hypothetical protein
VLLGRLKQNSHHITDLELQYNPTGLETRGSRIPGEVFEKQRVANLTRFSLYNRVDGDDGFIALMSGSGAKHFVTTARLVLRNTTLHQLCRCHSERAFLILTESLPEIKMLQRLDLYWYPGLASAMHLLLAGFLCKNTSLFRYNVANLVQHNVGA